MKLEWPKARILHDELNLEGDNMTLDQEKSNILMTVIEALSSSDRDPAVPAGIRDHCISAASSDESIPSGSQHG